jgi:protein-ribulosamine 3-kinase
VTLAAIDRAIGDATGAPFSVISNRAVGGGCINRAEIRSDGARRFFVKTNRAAFSDIFEAESDGLCGLASVSAFRVPHPICCGTTGDTAYLVLECLDLGGPSDGARAGRALAALHRCTGSRYGWHRDNYIGSTPQANAWETDWTRFWCEHRLGPQLALAARNGFAGTLQRPGERLLESLNSLIDHGPPPSILHGDLWGGNLGFADSGEPVVFDPAVYYGDREADVAMTELFGGFDNDFYAAYREAWPLDTGYAVRKRLYNLYHILNHLNLFGTGYLGQACRLLDALLAELR